MESKGPRTWAIYILIYAGHYQMVMAADISKECSAFFGFNFPRRVNLTSLFIPEVDPEKFLRNVYNHLPLDMV